MKYGIMALTFAAMVGCADTTVTQLARNQLLLSATAVPASGRFGSAQVAAKMAAVETLRRGFTRFVVLNANSQSNVTAISTGPTYANTYSNYSDFGNNVYGNSHTTFGGGRVSYVGTNDADLNVLIL